MTELYLFFGSLLLIASIVGRRAWIQNRWKKSEFQKKVAAKVEALKEEALKVGPERFREKLGQRQKENKLDYAKYKDFLRRAEVALAQGKGSEGENLLVQSLAFTKNPEQALKGLAGLYLERGEWKRAQALYEELIELNPVLALAHEALAKIHSRFKRYREAIAHFVKAVELEEKNDRYLVGLGKLYLLLMRPGLAAECFRRAAELKPREVEYLFCLAESCKADEDFDNALFTYEKILTLEPYNEKALSAAQEVRQKRKEMDIMIMSLKGKQETENRKLFPVS